MYQFTEEMRHTIYALDGVFGPLSSAIPTPHPWTYADSVLRIDLHFGNYSEHTPELRCEGAVLDLWSLDGTLHSTFFREGYPSSDCD